MVRVGVAFGIASGLEGEAAPLGGSAFVGPMPARQATRYSPPLAGELALTSDPSLCCAMSVPSTNAARPGVAGVTCSVSGVVSAPFALTMIS